MLCVIKMCLSLFNFIKYLYFILLQFTADKKPQNINTIHDVSSTVSPITDGLQHIVEDRPTPIRRKRKPLTDNLTSKTAIIKRNTQMNEASDSTLGQTPALPSVLTPSASATDSLHAQQRAQMNLTLRKSSQIGQCGIFTTAILSRGLMFGPYEGTPR